MRVCRLDGPSQAEISQQRAIRFRFHQDIAGFKVAVYDPFAMRRVERIRNLRRQPQRLPNRHRTLERPPVDVLHHEIIRPDVVQRADVRMIQRGNGACFPLEALGELLARNLDRHGAVEPCRGLSRLRPCHRRRCARRSRRVPDESQEQWP